jgi:hypothetical protein
MGCISVILGCFAVLAGIIMVLTVPNSSGAFLVIVGIALIIASGFMGDNNAGGVY